MPPPDLAALASAARAALSSAPALPAGEGEAR
jgi:hypothetical protein